MLPLLLAGLLLAQTPAADAELIGAARIGDATRAAALLAAGAPVDTPDARGFTPLMWASAGGHLDLVELLLEAGARPNARARDGSTALTLAAQNGAGPVVSMVVARGADVNATKGSATARELALTRGHVEVADWLQRAGELGSALVHAARATNTTLVRQLLALGAPVNTSDQQGVTAIMIAAGEANLGLMQFLLVRGADPTQQDDEGRSTFEWAERSPELGKHVAAYLAERGFTRSPVLASASTPPPLRTSLRSLGRLLARIPAGRTPASPAERRAADALARLNALSEKWPAESPEDYRASLDALVRMVEAAIGAGDPPRLEATLEALADDLESKLEHCLASGGKLGGSVLVRVRTLRGSEEVRNWQVFYMPKIFEVSDTATPDLFPQLSSPAEESLVPGRYLVWLRDPASGTLTPRTVVKVGEGRKELVVDVPLPPDAIR